MNNPQMGGYGNYAPGVGMGVAALPKAGFWIRFVAYLIDAIIFGLVAGILGAVLDQTIGSLVATVVWFAYLIFTSNALNGATVGKKLLGLRVVTEAGTAPDIKTLAMRYILGYIVSTIIFDIGFIMIGFDANKQGLHDKIAKTYVVRG